MSTSPEPNASITAEKKSRIGRIVCWAARLASIPIFGLLLISLIPALASFAVSAKDDRVIALGLGGIAVGFLVAWRWAGVGGLIALAGVAAIASQEGGGISADPFSVAFGLQGILFLISGVLNPPRSRQESAPRLLWLKGMAVGILGISAVFGAVIILRGPAPTPVSKQQEVYVGVWENGAGFRMEITAEGRVKINQDKDAKVDACNSPVTPGASGEFLAQFRDDRLELSGGVLGQTKVYHIDRRPIPHGKQIRMVLNGSDPYQRTNGMILLKQQAAGVVPQRSRAAKPASR